MVGEAGARLGRRDVAGALTLRGDGVMTNGDDRRRTDGWGTGSDDELDAGLTAEERAAERAAARDALRRLHVPVGGVCEWCGQPFPCSDSSGPTHNSCPDA